jgi:hypothetical protein
MKTTLDPGACGRSPAVVCCSCRVVACSPTLLLVCPVLALAGTPLCTEVFEVVTACTERVCLVV